MSERSLIGSATTDSNGVATLEYTGTGAGDLNIIAVAGDVESNIIHVEDYEPVATALAFNQDTFVGEVGSTISVSATLKDQYNSGIVGETVKLSTNGNKFIDKAVTGAKNTDWTGDGVVVTVGESNTTLAIEGSEYYAPDPQLKGDFEIVFDAVMSDTLRFAFVGGDKSTSIQANTTGKYRIKRINGVFTFERSADSGSTWTTISSRESDTLTTETCRFRFYNPITSERTISYSNFSIRYYSEYTATTNSSGVASFSISDLKHTGVYTFTASYGSLTSECTVTNARFYESNTGSTLNTNWIMDNGLTVGKVDGKVTASNSTSGNLFLRANKPNTSTDPDDWEKPFAVEFDVDSVTGGSSILLHIYDNSNADTVRTFNQIPISSNNHVKIVYDGTDYVISVDDVEKYSLQYTTTNKFRIGFRLGNGTSMTFNNFMIY